MIWRKPAASESETSAAKRVLVIHLGELVSFVQALAAAKHEWVLSIDADEEIDAELAESIRSAIESDEADG